MTVRQCRNPCSNFWGVSGDKREALSLAFLVFTQLTFYSLC
jgi:hypothetical protein